MIRHKKSILRAVLAFFVLLFILYTPARSQNPDITIDLNLSPSLNRAQVLTIPSIGNITGGKGRKLFDFIIRNNTNNQQPDLYLTIAFSSDKHGLIAEFFQAQETPFELKPRQTIVANNKQLKGGLPQIPNGLKFSGGLTDDGQEFINELEGALKLPQDLYTIKVSLYQNANSRNGGTFIDEVIRTFGGNLVEEITDLYLAQPSDEEILRDNLPLFKWEGAFNFDYRLIVVEASNRDSPESLIQSALSSEPFLVRGSSGSGTLLEYEALDAIVKNTTFKYPPNGVQSLKEGAKYYWQVFALEETIDGTDLNPSEIWSFTVASGKAVNGGEELHAALRRILGEERYNELMNQGFQLFSITQNGVTYNGAQALQKVVEFEEKLNSGEITVEGN